MVLGPLFLPLYLLCGGISARNRFERAADRYAGFGRGWWPWGMPRLVSDDVQTSGRPVLHPANGHRDNLHAPQKKRKGSEEHTSALQPIMRLAYAVVHLTQTHRLTYM